MGDYSLYPSQFNLNGTWGMNYLVRSMSGLFAAAALFLLAAGALAQPVTTHPRIWVRQSDLPRLRSWAVPGNPMYANGLNVAATAAKQVYDTEFFPSGVEANPWPDPGISNWVFRCTEAYAEFFAFMSLVENSQSVRDDYAQRSRKLLMHIMHEAVQGVAPNVNGNEVPFRSSQFSIYNRANYWSEAFGTTVDWIYPYLTSQDKADIRTVYLRWCNECLNAYTAGDEHPHPVGVVNSTQLLSDKKQLRWAANNYFTGHMRHVTLMSLCLDAADDPAVNPALPVTQIGNSLRSYITDATGAWLYQQYAAYEDPSIVSAAFGVPQTGLGFARGGLSVEGFLYGHALGYLQEALLALYTAGYGSPALSGPQINFLNSSYWDQFGDGFLHSIAPVSYVPAPATGDSYLGDIYQMATYGDILRFWIGPDQIGAVASLGIYSDMTTNSARAQKMRWIARNALEGGATKIMTRAGQVWGNSYATDAIQYFMLFDPNVATAPDPRPALPLDFYSPAIGRILSRSDWTSNASWFSFIDSWITINHQNGCGGQFEFYRKGEWLTQERAGYSNDNVGATPDYHNTLALKNDDPPTLQWYEGPISARGGQWKEGLCGGDPTTTASFGTGYAYALADITNLYNRPDVWTPANSAVDIQHASRSIVYLKPDHIIVYDRATSGKTNRFKRFNLNSQTKPAVAGNLVTVTTPGSQKMYVRSLLPAGTTITTSTAENWSAPAELEPMSYRIVIEDASNPTNVRFLNVIQGADAAVSADAATVIQSTAGTAFTGAAVHNTVVMFPVDLNGSFTPMTYVAPAGTTRHLVTGLAPSAGYTVTLANVGGNVQVTVAKGGSTVTDAGGVLSFNGVASISEWEMY